MGPRWALLRGANATVGALTVPVGALMITTSPSPVEWVLIALHAACVWTFMGAWNTFNDLMDIENDRINHPERPLPAGEITEVQAKALGRLMFVFSMLLLLGAMLVSSLYTDYLNRWIFSIGIWFLAFQLMFHYEMVVPASFMLKHKGLAGNLAVSLLVGLVIVFGAAAMGEWDSPLVWMVAASATLVNAAREIVKDVEDEEGDVDRETLSMVAGADTARAIAQVLVILSLVPLVLPFLLGYFPQGMLLTQAPAMFVLMMVKPRLYRGEDHEAQRSLRFAMLLGLGGFLASVLLV